VNSAITIFVLLVVYCVLVALAAFLGGFMLAERVAFVLAFPIAILGLCAWLDI